MTRNKKEHHHLHKHDEPSSSRIKRTSSSSGANSYVHFIITTMIIIVSCSSDYSTMSRGMFVSSFTLIPPSSSPCTTTTVVIQQQQQQPYNHHRLSPFMLLDTSITTVDITRVTTTTTTTRLSMKKGKRNGNNNNNGNSKRKKNNNTKMTANTTKGKNNKRSNNKKNKKESNSSSSSNNSNQQQQQPPKKSSIKSPPWNVMSTKDAKKNIKAEKQRRQNIQQGTIQSHITTNDDDNDDDDLIRGDVIASESLLSPTDRNLYSWKRFNPYKDVKGLRFVDAYLDKRLPPPLGIPEIAFLGRSNVGKSSLLNKLTTLKKSSASSASSQMSNNKSTDNTNESTKANDSARVGKTPGATASVNLYTLQSSTKQNKSLMAFADLPGFGYAKLSKEVKQSVELAAERYLGKRRELALGILLVDIRRIPSDDDRAVLAALYDMDVPLLVVATKVDKLRSKNAFTNALEEIRVGLGLPVGQPLCISSMTGQGVKDVWNIIMDACEDRVKELRAGEVEKTINGSKSGGVAGGGGGSGGIQADPDATIQLDAEGNWIVDEDDEEEEYDQGYEWIQSYNSGDNYIDEDEYDEYDDDDDDDDDDGFITEDSRRRMMENEEMQRNANDAMKLKNLKKTVRKLEREGGV